MNIKIGGLFKPVYKVIMIIIYYSLCNILTFNPAQKCYSKVMHRKEVTHSNGQWSKEIAWAD